MDIGRRRPVWEALSDLWRDTELQEFEIEHLARVLSESEYTHAELEEIHACEVSPVVWQNRTVWAGFDGEWLVAQIKSSLERQEQSRIYRSYVRSRLGRWMRTVAVKEDWAKVMERLSKRGRG